MSKHEPGHNEAAVHHYRGIWDGKDRFGIHFNGRHFWRRGAFLDAAGFAGTALKNADPDVEFEPATLVRPGGFLHLGHTRMTLTMRNVRTKDGVPLLITATAEFSLRHDADAIEALIESGLLAQLGKLLVARFRRAIQPRIGAADYQSVLASQDEMHARISGEMRKQFFGSPREGATGLGVALSSVSLHIEESERASELASELRQSGLRGSDAVASAAQVVATRVMARAPNALNGMGMAAAPFSFHRPVSEEIFLQIVARNGYPRGDPRYARRTGAWEDDSRSRAP
jgi:hypothetical protein